MLLSDPRTYQILFLALFLVLGIGTRDWTLHPGMIAVTIAICLTTQIVAEGIVGGRWQVAGGREKTEDTETQLLRDTETQKSSIPNSQSPISNPFPFHPSSPIPHPFSIPHPF